MRMSGDPLLPVATKPKSKLETTRDAFLGGRVLIAQPKTGHRAGVDAVLLAASIGVGDAPAQRIVDVGAGPGTVGLLIAQRLQLAHVTGVEIEPQLVALARKNVTENGFGARVKIVEADVCLPFQELEEAGFKANAYDQVVSNPPFYDEDRCRTSDNDLKRRANSMVAGGLERWVKFMTTVTRAGGMASIIYPADRMGELLEILSGRFGALEVFPIFPRIGVPARRVIVRGRKGSRAPLKIYQGLVLHEADGKFAREAKEILSLGAALDFELI